MSDNFSDAALVLLGHGSTQNVDSAAPVYQHAAELRRRRIFAQVYEAFWKQDPKIQQVLSRLAAPRVFIAPLFISEGYFSGEVIPRELGFVEASPLPVLRSRPAAEGGRTPHSAWFYCRPVGTHDSMTGVILDRAGEVIARFPFPRAPKPKDFTLFVAGHGTERNENSRKSIERQVGLLRAQNLYAAVHTVFMEEDPRIGECYALAQTRNIVVVPFFISDGLHTQEDIPILLGEPERSVKQRLEAGRPTWHNPTERNGKRVWYSPAVGTDPLVADVILERVIESASPSSS